MCVWTSVNYGCGHHETQHEMCKIKRVAQENGFIHAVQCRLVDAILEQPRPCSRCQKNGITTISQGKQQPQELGQDARNTLPSQVGKKKLYCSQPQDAKAQRAEPPHRLPNLASILQKKRTVTARTWQGSAKATALEVARRERLGVKSEDFMPSDGHVLGQDGQLWLTAAAHLKQKQRRIPVQGAHRAAETGQQSSSVIRRKPLPALPQESKVVAQESASAQQEAELFFEAKEPEKVDAIPSCLIPGPKHTPSQKFNFSQLSVMYDGRDAYAEHTTSSQITIKDDHESHNPPQRKVSFSQLSADFKAATRRDGNAGYTTEPTPAQGKSAAASSIISAYQAYGAEKKQATSVVFLGAAKPAAFPSTIAPRLPMPKRISPLHFEGTLLESLHNLLN